MMENVHYWWPGGDVWLLFRGTVAKCATQDKIMCVCLCVRVWVWEEIVLLWLIKSTQTYYRLRGKWNSYLLTLLACYKWHLCSEVSSGIEWKALFQCIHRNAWQGTSCTEHNYNLLCHHVWPFSVSPGALRVSVNNESDPGGRNQSMESHLISKWIFLPLEVCDADLSSGPELYITDWKAWQNDTAAIHSNPTIAINDENKSQIWEQIHNLLEIGTQINAHTH